MVFLFRIFIGVFFCLTPVTAVIAVGWTVRAMRRSSLNRLHALSGDGGGDFPAFAAASPETVAAASWPRWVLGLPGQDHGIARVFGGLWANLRAGVLALTNVWLLTLPAGLIWLGSWWAGWNNSFNKGYEQAAIGPVTGLAGFVLFALVMTYIPAAQARQALSGRWRSFWDFRIVRRLAGTVRFRLLVLAVLTLVAALPVTGIRAFPLTAQNVIPEFATRSGEELRQFAELFYLAAGFFVFPAYVVLHLLAARLYASAVARAVRADALASVALTRPEWQVLERLGIGDEPPAGKSPAILAAAGTAGRGILRIASVVTEIAAWAALAALVYVQQFLIYLWFAWLTHPLIHLPWVRQIPF